MAGRTHFPATMISELHHDLSLLTAESKYIYPATVLLQEYFFQSLQNGIILQISRLPYARRTASTFCYDVDRRIHRTTAKIPVPLYAKFTPISCLINAMT